MINKEFLLELLADALSYLRGNITIGKQSLMDQITEVLKEDEEHRQLQQEAEAEAKATERMGILMGFDREEK